MNKYLAECGISSRRAADKLIEEGMVKINGVVVKKLGVKIDPSKDKILVGGKQIQPEKEKIYYMINKPKGYVTTSFDPLKRKKVTDLVPKGPRVFSVGRLDKDTTGLLILTNDGGLAYGITHPKFKKEKEYEVKANKIRSKTQNYVLSLMSGMKLKEGFAKADKIDVIKENDKYIYFNIVIHQGWKRQIRRMCDKIGLGVMDLRRIRIGELELGDLGEGECRELSKTEVTKLLS